MKIKIEIDEQLVENEIIIRCKQVDSSISKIQEAITNITSHAPNLLFYKDDTQYYLPLKEILFFETTEQGIHAHTADDVYQIKYRLYELEELLPKSFIRVAKSTILNINAIYSISHLLTSSYLVAFNKSHKQVYVSRFYIKALKARLEERRNYEI
ncbi:MAG: LytTR family DNA-binding domain-containing protein [Clostridia bacterium]